MRMSAFALLLGLALLVLWNTASAFAQNGAPSKSAVLIQFNDSAAHSVSRQGYDGRPRWIRRSLREERRTGVRRAGCTPSVTQQGERSEAVLRSNWSVDDTRSQRLCQITFRCPANWRCRRTILIRSVFCWIRSRSRASCNWIISNCCIVIMR